MYLFCLFKKKIGELLFKYIQIKLIKWHYLLF